MKANRILFLFTLCFVLLNVHVKAQVNTPPSTGLNNVQNFYFSKPASSIPFNFTSPITQIQSSVPPLQFHFELIKITGQNKYYEASLDKMICITPNMQLNDHLNAVPIYKIQDLSKMPNAFPKSEMITIK